MSSLIRVLFPMLVAVTVSVACATKEPLSWLPPASTTPLEAYLLDSGDQLRVVVYGQDDIPTDYVVDDQGFISVPLAGPINVRGMTPTQLEQAIAERMERVLVNPSVSVQLMALRPFYIVGEVRVPGEYPYVKNMTVKRAVAIGGGFTLNAYPDTVQITRQIGGRSVELRAGMDDFVYPEDVITIYEITGALGLTPEDLPVRNFGDLPERSFDLR